MEPRIENSGEKKIVGKRLVMSFADYRVSELWRSFMPRLGEITNRTSDDMISMAIYEPGHFARFDPMRGFEKWAAVEVSDFLEIPDGMESFELPAGLYAVFDYKGSNTDNAIYQYIFGTWLPGSEYLLDVRPHFEILGGKYKNNDPNSEEQIWVPVKLK